VPFNAPRDRPCRVFIDDGSDLHGKSVETLEISTCDQYRIQGDLFSRAILEGKGAPVPLEDAVANLRTIDAVFRSAKAAGGRSLNPPGPAGVRRGFRG
jgi:predicted dehydrogenase